LSYHKLISVVAIITTKANISIHAKKFTAQLME